MTATMTAAAAKEAAAAAAATAQSTGTALWNRMRAAKDAINVAITGEERWPGMCAKIESGLDERRKKTIHA